MHRFFWKDKQAGGDLYTRARSTTNVVTANQRSHYTSISFRQNLWRLQIRQSMSRREIVGIMPQWNGSLEV
jgi:transposase InsO family protein